MSQKACPTRQLLAGISGGCGSPRWKPVASAFLRQHSIPSSFLSHCEKVQSHTDSQSIVCDLIFTSRNLLILSRGPSAQKSLTQFIHLSLFSFLITQWALSNLHFWEVFLNDFFDYFLPSLVSVLFPDPFLFLSLLSNFPCLCLLIREFLNFYLPTFLSSFTLYYHIFHFQHPFWSF